MTKTDITRDMLAELHRLGRLMIVVTNDQEHLSVEKVTGQLGATFFHTRGGKVLVAAEIHHTYYI